MADFLINAMSHLDVEEMEVDEQELMDDGRLHNRASLARLCTIAGKSPLYRSNVAALLASVKDFEELYMDIFEEITKEPQAGLTNKVLNTDVWDTLMRDYENDCYLAMMKFNTFSHLIHVEECLRSASPIIENERCVAFKAIGRGQMRIEFELDTTLILTNSFVFLCECDVLEGNGAFFAFEGRAFVERDKLAVEFKPVKGVNFNRNAKYVVFEKPFETTFESWQYMIKVFREKEFISQKMFGPAAFDHENTLDKHYAVQSRVLDSMFDNPSMHFNAEQKQAIFSMVRQDPRNAFVLFGPPGTGKTTTLVEAIRVIRKNHEAQSKQASTLRFLICTPSNAAADAIALALLERRIMESHLIFRAIASRYDTEGYDRRLNDIVKKRGDMFCMPESSEELRSFEVIISTIGFCHTLKCLGKKFFTHIIIDEAGQCLEGETFIPIAFCGNEETKVILAGDPEQLGPTILSDYLTNPKFKMHQSSLLRLAQTEEYKKDPRLMIQLRDNHRSHEFMVDLVSHMFYNNTLRCTRPLGHDSLCYSPILDNNPIPVRFICVYGKEVETSPSFYNPEEMAVVQKYVEKCINSRHGLKPADIGVVCPYRESVRRMQVQFKRYPGMTVDTVERFQGSERRVIIVTTVRTASVGFLQEYRRFNTAITRAKHMLIVIGDPRLLIKDPVWQQFLFYLHQNQCFDPNTTDPHMINWWNNYFAANRGD